MTYRGRVKNGVVVLEEPVSLPDGVVVEVRLVPAEGEESTLGQRLMKFAGKAKGLPSDLAANHDHYLHGVAKD